MADKEARGDGRQRQAGVTHAVRRGEEEGFKKRGGKRLNVTQVTTVFLKEHVFQNIHSDLPKTKLERYTKKPKM